MTILHNNPSGGTRRSKIVRKITDSKKTIKTMALPVAVTGIVILLALALVVSIVLAWISHDLPDPNTLRTRDVAQTTRIYDRTGEHLLYEVHGDENRSLIQIKDLPSYVPHATVAIEDKSFYTHHGVSWAGLIRAFLTSIFHASRVKGTSTLTQQLVKNAVLTNERTLTRKLKELLLSLQIERVYTKDQILQMYLNEIPYGSNMYGVEAAAKGYFGKSAKDLTLDEAALLSALPQAPDLYSPYGTGSRGDNRSTLVSRQHYILDQMAEQGYVTKAEAEDAQKIDTLKKIVPKKFGNITAPHFVMYVRSLLEAKYGQNTVEHGGLKVLTTLDWDKQQIATDEVIKGVELRGPKYNFTNAALISIDPKNGQILAMVGSKDFFDTEHDGQVNVVLRPRQPGSSIKPIVYAASFIKGYTPDTTLWDVNTTFKTDIKNYEPKDYDLKERGPLSVRQALQGSLNIPAVKMLYLVGVSRVLDFAESLGYTTFGDRSRFGLSLVLGGGEVKLIDHANAYAAFANEGVQYPTSAIMKVEDANGKTLEEWKQLEGKTVMEKGIAQMISNILSDNAARAYIFGAHNYLTLPGRPAAAKTGTTNDFHDGWCMGYTPSLVTGVWAGNNDNAALKKGADGSQIAAPIWQAYMTRALDKTRSESFTSPPQNDATKPVLLGKAFEIQVAVDKVSGKLATDLTPPDQIEKRTFHEAHEILYYLDKDDPRGPAPEHPEQDPQYTNWEAGVQNWVTHTGWSTTSTAPTSTDDVHVAANIPMVTITSPIAHTTITSRTVTFNTSITAPRRISRVEISSEGQIIGQTTSEPWAVQAIFPNSMVRGFHDVIVTAIDDLGDRGSSTITINLNSDPTPVNISILEPTPGTRLNTSSFPIAVSLSVNDITDMQRLNLYLQMPDGSTRLIGSSVSPVSGINTIQWSFDPGPGTYSIYGVLVDIAGRSHPGDTLRVTHE